MADLQYPSLEDLNELDDIEEWEHKQLIDFCKAARRHYGRSSLEQEEQERMDAERTAHAARRAAYTARSGGSGTSANLYFVAK